MEKVFEIEEVFKILENSSTFEKEVIEEIVEALSQYLYTKEELIRRNIYNEKINKLALRISGSFIKHHEELLQEKKEIINELDKEIKDKDEIIFQKDKEIKDKNEIIIQKDNKMNKIIKGIKCINKEILNFI